MKITFKRSLAGVGALALASGALMFIGVGAASAITPSWEPDAASLGPVTFYDASGAVITGGALDAHPMASYFVGAGGLTPSSPANGKATAYAFKPVNPNPTTWSGDTLSASTSFPHGTFYAGTTASYPEPLKSAGLAIAHSTNTDFSMNDFLGEYPAGSVGGLAPDIYQIRVNTGDNNQYYATDIQVDTANNHWSIVYPANAITPTATSVSAVTYTPSANPAPSGTTAVDLSATVSAADSSHPYGFVHLWEDGVDEGDATFNYATGAASAHISGLSDGDSHTFQFKFTPAGAYGSSQDAASTYSVHAPIQTPTVHVLGSAGGTVGLHQTVTATVAAAVGATPTGTVQFKLDGANLGSAVSVADAASSGVQYTPANTSTHTITAVYTSNDTASWTSVDSSTETGDALATLVVTASAPTTPVGTDDQTVTVTVPAGSLVISTPYTATHPLDLGTLQLNAGGTAYDTTPVGFGDVAAAASALAAANENLDSNPTANTTNGVTITDTRAASPGWTAKIQTTDFTKTGGTTPIGGDLLTFDTITPKFIAGNALQSGDVAVATDNTGLNWTTSGTGSVNDLTNPTAFAKTTVAGAGTVAISGKMHLDDVPTSTEDGTYKATLTFTIF